MTPLHACFLALVLASSAHGSLFVSNFSESAVYQFNEKTGGYVGTFVAERSGELNFPQGVTFGPDGNLYVASAGNDRILRYNAHGQFIDTFIANGAKGLPMGTLDFPVDILFEPNGRLYVSSRLTDSVLRFDSATGMFIDTFVAAGSGGLDDPRSMEFHDGDLYVLGQSSNKIHRYDGQTGAFEAALGGDSLSSPYGFDFGADGNLYVGSSEGRVVKVDPATGAGLGDFVPFRYGGLGSPTGVRFGPGGDLFVGSLQVGQSIPAVKRYDSQSGAFLGEFQYDRYQLNYFTFSSVPEPSTAGLLATSCTLLAISRRRKASEN